MENNETALPEFPGAPEADPKVEKKKPVKRRPAARRRAGGEDLKTARRNARTAARRTLAVAEADSQTRSLVASVLGCEDDVVEITAHLLAPAKGGNPSGVLDDLAAVEDQQDRIQRVLALADLGADRMAALREALLALGRVSGTRPANETALAVELADAVVGAGEKLEPVRELIG